MTTLSAYLQTWRLKLSNTKTVTVAFHFKNREAKRELNVYNIGHRLPPCPVPTYLGVKLDWPLTFQREAFRHSDRSLTFRHHLDALCKKLSIRVALLKQLAGFGLGAGA